MQTRSGRSRVPQKVRGATFSRCSPGVLSLLVLPSLGDLPEPSQLTLVSSPPPQTSALPAPSETTCLAYAPTRAAPTVAASHPHLIGEPEAQSPTRTCPSPEAVEGRWGWQGVQTWGEGPGGWDPDTKAWQLPRCVFAQGLRAASHFPSDGAAPSLHKVALGASAASLGPVRLATARGSVHPHHFPCSLPPALQFQLEVRFGEMRPVTQERAHWMVPRPRSSGLSPEAAIQPPLLPVPLRTEATTACSWREWPLRPTAHLAPHIRAASLPPGALRGGTCSYDPKGHAGQCEDNTWEGWKSSQSCFSGGTRYHKCCWTWAPLRGLQEPPCWAPRCSGVFTPPPRGRPPPHCALGPLYAVPPSWTRPPLLLTSDQLTR